MGIYFPSYFSNSRAYPRNNKAKTTVSNILYTADNVWAASAAAFRINGDRYVKFQESRYDEVANESVVTAQPNKILVKDMLVAGNGWTEDDMEAGKQARTYWNEAGLMKVISGTVNDYEKTLIEIAAKEEINSNYDVAVIASAVGSAKRSEKMDERNRTVSYSDSKWVGTLKGTIQTELTVMVSFYSKNIGRYRNEAQDAEGNLFAWWGDELTTGSKLNIKGRIKAHILDRATSAKVTQLNYVKVK